MEAKGIWYGGLADLGIEVYDIEFGADDYVVYRWIRGEERGRLSRAKIRFDRKGDGYFKSKGRKIPFAEILRCLI